MPEFAIAGDTLELPRNIALLDTNVLVAYFSPDDSLHENTKAYFELNEDFIFAVTPPVVVETCGMLSARKHAPRIKTLMQWLTTPGNAIVFPTHFRPAIVAQVLARNAAWMSNREIDYVDSYLMHIADAVTTTCHLRPHLPILTYDTGDYIKSANQDFKFSVLDMHVGELIEFT